jgi:hypothetical protein
MPEVSRDSASEPASDFALLTWRLQIALALFSFCVFLFSPVLGISDSKYSMLTADSLVRFHTADLSGYSIPYLTPNQPPFDWSNPHTFQLGRVNGKVLYWFPHGSSWLSAPFVVALELAGIGPANSDRSFNLRGEMIDQKLLAALLMTAMVVLIFRTSLILLDRWWSLAIAIASGFGSPIWSTASRAMWSHTWEILLGGCVVYLLLDSEHRAKSIRPVLLATLLSWMYFVRPTGAVPIACVGVRRKGAA